MLGLPDVTRACLFDLDGVLTDTASVHAAAWKQMFDDFLRAHAERAGTPFEPFDVKTDYGPYVDGKPRLDGTRAFLASRGITLPEGEPTDGPDDETINGLATRKNELVHEKIRTDGVDVYPGSVRYLHAVRDAGLVTAVVSSSANAEVVLQVAGLADLIDHRVDGVVAKQRHLPGKPAPDTFLAAAADLDVPKEQAVVFEDALAGVAAGKAGGFGLVVGVDRLGQADALREHGADVVVADLADLLGGEPMSPDPGRPFTVEPWIVREPSLDMESLGVTETVFALSNGHIGLRGNLDEGEPHATPGTYLNSFYERRPLPYAEGGYGYPESGQTIINVTNGKIIRLLVDDEPFDLRYGQVHRHQRVLDLQSGTLTREVRWSSPAGKTVKVRSERLVSLTQRAVAAICYEVEVEDQALIVVQSELVANEQLPTSSGGDPRVEAALLNPLVAEQHRSDDAGATLVHHTRHSGLRVAAAMDHEVRGPEGTKITSEASEDIGRTTVICRLEPGTVLRVVKYLAYGWSSRRSLPAVHDQVRAGLAAARYTGWEGLRSEQRTFLDEFWTNADVEIEGDAELQQAVRVAVFHVLQAGARAERRAIGAKGLTGPGYDGHTFWDTETFCLPVLSHLQPDAAADALRWRQSILPLARERAEQLGLSGATFPWRTIRGQECSGYWPAGTAAFHINADIADAVRRHVLITATPSSSARSGSSCSSPPRGCGARWATTTRPASSASTA